MELFFLIKRVYPPYYKWTYRALTEIDTEGSFSGVIKELAEAECRLAAWEHIGYSPVNLNMSDRVVALSERVGEILAKELLNAGLVKEADPYLEKHVDAVSGYQGDEI